MKRFRSGLNFDLFTASERSAFIRGKTAHLVLQDRVAMKDERTDSGWRLAGLVIACMWSLPNAMALWCRVRPA